MSFFIVIFIVICIVGVIVFLIVKKSGEKQQIEKEIDCLKRIQGRLDAEYLLEREIAEAKKNDDKKTQPAINKISYFDFIVDGLQTNFKEFSYVGESVKLWIPKDDAEKVFIYHRDGPGGCLGIVPSKYTNIIISHLKKASEYEAVIEDLAENKCKIKCRLISKKETMNKIEGNKASLKAELTKPYKPKGTIKLELRIKNEDNAKAGDKLEIVFSDLDTYLQDVSTKRGPFSCQWHLRFLNQKGETVSILNNNKSTIQKILKAHFNSYLFDIEVSETFNHLKFSEEKQRSNWEGYPIKVLIKPYKNEDSGV